MTRRMGSVMLFVVFAILVTTEASAWLGVGDEVLVLDGKAWYPAVVVEVDDVLILVQYLDREGVADEWVGPAAIDMWGESFCTSAYDCLPSQGCWNGACGQCSMFDDCRFGETCDEGACVPAKKLAKPQCTSNGDCAPGKSCILGQCVTCIDDDDCRPGELCTEKGCRALPAPSVVK